MILDHKSYPYGKYVSGLIFLSLILLGFYSSLYGNEADTFNEDDLFFGSETVVETLEIMDESIMTETDKPSISLSGSVYNNNYYSTVRDDFILDNDFSDNEGEYAGRLTANLLLDMRYKKGIKGFVNADAIYHCTGKNEPGKTDKTYADLTFREYFFDYNVLRKIYFRLGRQYLKWGRNYFWNPSDLVNIDKKDFLDPDKNLEGTQGVKIHIPFGTKYNIYGFANLEDGGDLEDVGWSGKFEFIAGSTEMAISGWYKEGYEPVFSYDFSTRLFHIDITGEISLSYGANRNTLSRWKADEGVEFFTTTRLTDEWIPVASLGFMKSFDLFDIDDRVTIFGELFYDRAGYSYNVFDNPESIQLLLGDGLYKPYHMSRCYASFFTSIKRFFSTDAVFSLNVISNLIDGSGIIYSSLRYNPWYDFHVNLTASFALGNGSDEFTFMGSDKTIGLEFRYNF